MIHGKDMGNLVRSGRRSGHMSLRIAVYRYDNEKEAHFNIRQQPATTKALIRQAAMQRETNISTHTVYTRNSSTTTSYI